MDRQTNIGRQIDLCVYTSAHTRAAWQTSWTGENAIGTKAQGSPPDAKWA